MDIKVQRIEDGPAKVQVIDPEQDGAVVQEADVNVGQEVTVTTSDGPENPPYIGEVAETPAQEPAAAEPGDGGVQQPDPKDEAEPQPGE